MEKESSWPTGKRIILSIVATRYRREKVEPLYPVHSVPPRDGELPCGHMSLQEVPRAPLELPELNKSYLALIRGSLNDTKSFSESQEFDLSQGLCQNVSDLFICIDMLEPYSSPLHHISNIVVPDIDMLGAIMEYGIL